MLFNLSLLICLLFFGDNPEVSFVVSTIFIFSIINDIRIDLKKGFLPLIQVLFLKFFVEQVYALTILETMSTVYNNIDISTIRAVSFEDINLLVQLSCFGIYIGFDLFFKKTKAINIQSFKFENIKIKPIISFYILVTILKLAAIPSLNFPIHVLDYLLTVFLIMNVSLNLNLTNPLLYLLFFNIFLSIKSGMIGSGLFYIILIILLYTSTKILKSQKTNTELSRFALLSFILLPAFIYFISILQTVKHEVRKSWVDSSVKQKNIFILAYDEMLNTTYPAEFYLKNLLYRLNQATLVSHTLAKVPKDLPFEYGATILRSLGDAFSFRFLDEDKEKSGGREKFEKYTGHALVGYTSMNIGIIGESYVNFGTFFSFFFNILVGILIAFFLSLINSILKNLDRVFQATFKIAVCAIIFDSLSDYQMFLNAIVKTIFIFYVLAFAIKNLSLNKERIKT